MNLKDLVSSGSLVAKLDKAKAEQVVNHFSKMIDLYGALGKTEPQMGDDARCAEIIEHMTAIKELLDGEVEGMEHLDDMMAKMEDTRQFAQKALRSRLN